MTATMPIGGTTATDLAAITDICLRAADGDLEARIVGIDEEDELAPVCHAVNRVLDVADAFVREASAAMDSCAQGRFHRPILERGLRSAYRQGAAIINRAAISMRVAHEQVQFAGRLAVENAEAVTTVAAACEELRASGAEISRQAGQAVAMTEAVVEQATAAVSAAATLREAERTIRGIVSLIHRVAGQTNLLALNATIEAARAGDHGKGFAVVATEVKDLSRNTAGASEEITRELERMVSSVDGVVTLLDEIKASITQAHKNADAIELATREQTYATAEISARITDVSRNTALVSERIGGQREA